MPNKYSTSDLHCFSPWSFKAPRRKLCGCHPSSTPCSSQLCPSSHVLTSFQFSISCRLKLIDQHKCLLNLLSIYDYSKTMYSNLCTSKLVKTNVHNFFQLKYYSKPSKMIQPIVYRRMKTSLQETSTASCPQPGCDFSCDSILAFSKHYLSCPFGPSRVSLSNFKKLIKCKALWLSD